jgi:hypothetical protein
MATQVSNAASAAFPPSSAILTAFTYVMNASKHVSEDYDMIESFFDIMQSFLQRLSLLENKIPAQRAFQEFLIKVFSSLLILSGLARSYCLKGRFMKWAKALVDGKDPELQGAYDTLHENLKGLESATIIQTLRKVIETNEEARATNQNVKALQAQAALLQTSLDKNTVITEQTYDVAEKTLTITMETDSGMKEVVLRSRDSASMNQEILRRQDDLAKALKKIQSRGDEEKKRSLTSGASKPANFDRLKNYLGNPAEHGMLERQRDLELAYVNGIFDWIEKEPALVDVVDDGQRLLWVSAASGMGKSTLCFKVFRYLKEKYSYDSTTCVACLFFVEEHSEMQSIQNMLKWCSLKAAEKDARYCEETLMDLRRNGLIGGNDEAWQRLVESKYSKGSNRRLILILDGIDENEDEDFAKLVEIFGRIISQECQIHVIFTSYPDKEADLSTLGAKRIELVKGKIAHDMRRFIWFQTRTLSRLQKLRTGARKAIMRKVFNKADCK